MAEQNKKTTVQAAGGFFKAVGNFFAEFGTAVVKGDLFVKLSLLWLGAGYARRKQYVKAVLMTILEIAVIPVSYTHLPEWREHGTLGTYERTRRKYKLGRNYNGNYKDM